MKTNPQNQILLKDGRSCIANWTCETGQRLTVGDRIQLPQTLVLENKGYGPGAVVTKVEHSCEDGSCRIEAEADCQIPAHQRTVVTLNASRIRSSLRAAVEALVRERLELPLIEWEESFESDPVLRLHAFGTTSESCLQDLRQGVIRLLADSLEPTEC